MPLFLNFSKKKNTLNEDLYNYGVCVGELSYKDKVDRSRILLCLIRALLLFMASFGTVGAMVSSFNLSYRVIPVIIASLAICTFIAFLYYNRITFYVGYISYFILFVFGTLSMYIYVYSGFQAFFNTAYEKYSDYFALSTLREATELVTDRKLTVSFAMVFIVAFLALLLNIAISGYMSLLATFLITFPLIQYGLYIDCRPSTIYLVMLLGVYITVAILSRSSHYRLPDYKKSKVSFNTSLHKKTGLITHSYLSDGKSMFTVSIYSIIFCAFFLLATNTIFYSDFGSKLATNKLKATTDEYVKIFIQNGVWGFFDRYSAKGGLSSGQLGGVSSVRPDYMTDLEVTFVPLNNNSLYLKAYEGANYANNLFRQLNSMYDTNKNAYCIPEHIPSSENPAKISIKNIDAGRQYNFMPYYGLSIDNEEASDEAYTYDGYYIPAEYSGRISIHNKLTATFISPDLFPLVPASIPTKTYEENVYDTYLSVPYYLEECLDNFIYDTELYYYKDALTKDMPLAERQKTILEIAETLRLEFQENYPYTMAPGSTPRNEDFIEYFLTKQKRGYCAHYASSSALILRELGIPTKYVEGYMISLSDIMDAEAVTSDTTGWVDPDTDLSLIDTGVVTVNVTDGSAHGWTEIYIDGYGWMPYDFTPPSLESNLTNFNLGSLFSSLFRSSLGNESETDEDATDDTDGGNSRGLNLNWISSSFGFILYPMTCIVIIVFLIIICSKMTRYWIIKLRIRSELNRHNYSKALQLQYILFHAFCMKKLKLSGTITASDMLLMLNNYNIIDSMTLNTLNTAINKALYGANALSQDEYLSAYKQLKIAKGMVKKYKPSKTEES